MAGSTEVVVDDLGICLQSIVYVLDDNALTHWCIDGLEEGCVYKGLCYLELVLHTEAFGISIGIIFPYEHEFELLCLADRFPFSFPCDGSLILF